MRRRFLRSAVAGVLATAADAACFAALASAGGPAGPSAIAGATFGGVIGFVAQRRWVFASQGPATIEAPRYVVVSAGSALVHGLLVALLAEVVSLPLAAWALSRALVFAIVTYPLFQAFVFRATRR